MSTCKTCGTIFHYCCSCGDDGYSEYDFCSQNCMATYKEVQSEKLALKLVDLKLTTEQLNGLISSIRDLDNSEYLDDTLEIVFAALERIK